MSNSEHPTATAAVTSVRIRKFTVVVEQIGSLLCHFRDYLDGSSVVYMHTDCTGQAGSTVTPKLTSK